MEMIASTPASPGLDYTHGMKGNRSNEILISLA